ncbi:hypothetical protein [Streptomyces viridochromogenes]|uniref:hypothetical protein n=1 Tax=Streptomyces viridochromogenes TaxID=1938 RepID=UPI000AEBD37B|nr:hypothetical protein [Streptomyces viridochromogenes]
MPMMGMMRAEGVKPLPGCGTKCLHVRDKEDVPHEYGLPDLYALSKCGITEHILAGSKIALPAGMELVGDPADWDCALIVRPDTPPSCMRRALAALRLFGLEPLDEDEAEPELLYDESVRFWLVPIDPEDPFETDDDVETIA